MNLSFGSSRESFIVSVTSKDRYR